ncbi:ABC transporter permease subunit [Jidongwangia harbinensis]|uniref:ABC transporter permease subunit n=1 Tax=Jidongwangia harbinensis TaxID=2878561 RepID=UPI001CDA4FA2|nr:ABC transporter permease subunit [Jidongwangia harbinensis]MCA2212041.1 ABC transporter permease subunit [Jidongwangia harbinensis]
MLGTLGRAGALAGTAAGLALVVAALPWLRGDDPARSVLRARLSEREPDRAALDAVRAELDLPAHPAAGAADWLLGAATGDLGRSWVDGTPVRATVAAAAGASVTLAAAACVVAVLTALLLVAPVAWNAAGTGRRWSSGPRVMAAGTAALPEFVLAAVLLTLVAVRWRLAPAAGWFGPSYVVLPALALGVPTGGMLARLVVTAVDTTAAEAWVRTWRTAGCPRATLAVAVARRAGTVVVPQVAILFVGLLGGAVAVEELFAVPGVGRLALRAALAQDLPVVQGCVLLLILAGAVMGAAGVAAHRGLLGPAGAAGLVPAAPVRRPRRWRIPLAVGTLLAGAVTTGLLRDPDRVRLDRRLGDPSWAHPLGTDPVGRDVLAQFGNGALLTIGTAAAVTALALLVGLAVGLRGTRARAGGADVLNALPPVLVGLVIAAVLGPGLLPAATAAALVAWVPLAVHTRNLADETRAGGHHQAAVLAGAGTRWILRRHLVPAVAGPVVVHALTRIPGTALAIAALGFLGLGAGHDTAEWGTQLAAAVDYLERAPTAVAAPVAGLTLLGVLAAYAPEDVR